MRRAQGNTRSSPDGFLHIQNFTVTKHAGMAAVIYTHILDKGQQGLVQDILWERAVLAELAAEEVGVPYTAVMSRHGYLRFSKNFLKENFMEAVHQTTKAMNLPVAKVFLEKLIAERESLPK